MNIEKYKTAKKIGELAKYFENNYKKLGYTPYCVEKSAQELINAILNGKKDDAIKYATNYLNIIQKEWNEFSSKYSTNNEITKKFAVELYTKAKIKGLDAHKIEADFIKQYKKIYREIVNNFSASHEIDFVLEKYIEYIIKGEKDALNKSIKDGIHFRDAFYLLRKSFDTEIATESAKKYVDLSKKYSDAAAINILFRFAKDIEEAREKLELEKRNDLIKFVPKIYAELCHTY